MLLFYFLNKSNNKSKKEREFVKSTVGCRRKFQIFYLRVLSLSNMQRISCHTEADST